jgi:hypothetical protein
LAVELHLQILIAVIVYLTAPGFGRNSPGSDDFANFEEYQKREMPKMLDEHLHVLLEREHESVEEKFKSELLSMVRDCNTEIMQRYQQLRRSITSTPAAAQSNHGSGIDTHPGGLGPGLVGSTPSEDRLEAMYYEPPPPQDFESAEDYATAHLQEPDMNDLNLQSLNSSQNSASNRLSTASLMQTRRPPQSSRTSFSESQVWHNNPDQGHSHTSQHRSQHRALVRPNTRSELLTHEQPLSGPIERRHSGDNHHRNQQIGRLPQFTFGNHPINPSITDSSYMQTPNAGTLLSATYGPSSSSYSSDLFFNGQTPRMTDLPNTDTSAWPFHSVEFSVTPFQQNEIFSPQLMQTATSPSLNWSSGLHNDNNINEPRLSEENFNNDVELEPEFSQPKRRRR